MEADEPEHPSLKRTSNPRWRSGYHERKSQRRVDGKLQISPPTPPPGTRIRVSNQAGESSLIPLVDHSMPTNELRQGHPPFGGAQIDRMIVEPEAGSEMPRVRLGIHPYQRPPARSAAPKTLGRLFSDLRSFCRTCAGKIDLRSRGQRRVNWTEEDSQKLRFFANWKSADSSHSFEESGGGGTASGGSTTMEETPVSDGIEGPLNPQQGLQASVAESSLLGETEPQEDARHDLLLEAPVLVTSETVQRTPENEIDTHSGANSRERQMPSMTTQSSRATSPPIGATGLSICPPANALVPLAGSTEVCDHLPPFLRQQSPNPTGPVQNSNDHPAAAPHETRAETPIESRTSSATSTSFIVLNDHPAATSRETWPESSLESNPTSIPLVPLTGPAQTTDDHRPVTSHETLAESPPDSNSSLIPLVPFNDPEKTTDDRRPATPHETREERPLETSLSYATSASFVVPNDHPPATSPQSPLDSNPTSNPLMPLTGPAQTTDDYRPTTSHETLAESSLDSNSPSISLMPFAGPAQPSDDHRPATPHETREERPLETNLSYATSAAFVVPNDHPPATSPDSPLESNPTSIPLVPLTGPAQPSDDHRPATPHETREERPLETNLSYATSATFVVSNDHPPATSPESPLDSNSSSIPLVPFAGPAKSSDNPSRTPHETRPESRPASNPSSANAISLAPLSGPLQSVDGLPQSPAPRRSSWLLPPLHTSQRESHLESNPPSAARSSLLVLTNPMQNLRDHPPATFHETQPESRLGSYRSSATPVSLAVFASPAQNPNHQPPATSHETRPESRPAPNRSSANPTSLVAFSSPSQNFDGLPQSEAPLRSSCLFPPPRPSRDSQPRSHVDRNSRSLAGLPLSMMTSSQPDLSAPQTNPRGIPSTAPSLPSLSSIVEAPILFEPSDHRHSSHSVPGAADPPMLPLPRIAYGSRPVSRLELGPHMDVGPTPPLTTSSRLGHTLQPQTRVDSATGRPHREIASSLSSPSIVPGVLATSSHTTDLRQNFTPFTDRNRQQSAYSPSLPLRPPIPQQSQQAHDMSRGGNPVDHTTTSGSAKYAVSSSSFPQITSSRQIDTSSIGTLPVQSTQLPPNSAHSNVERQVRLPPIQSFALASSSAPSRPSSHPPTPPFNGRQVRLPPIQSFALASSSIPSDPSSRPSGPTFSGTPAPRTPGTNAPPSCHLDHGAPVNPAASSHPSVPLFQPRPQVPLFPVSSGHMFPTPEAPSTRTSNAPQSSPPHSPSNPPPMSMGDNVNVPTPQPNDQASYLQTVVHLAEERFGDLRAQIAANTLALETQMSDIRHDLDSVTTSSSRKGKGKRPRCETLDHPYRSQFMGHLAAHLLYLLKITSKAKLSTIAPPTDAEVAAFNARAPGAIRITETNWRYDFSRKCTEAFNREGIAVFAESFMRLVDQGWYAVPKPLPPPFRNENVVATAFMTQLPYLQTLYRVKEVDESLDNSGKPSRSRGRRKKALTADRLSITNSDPELRRHRAIMKAGGKAAVSSDESDDEPLHSATKVYRRVRPGWRSRNLESLHRSADESIAREGQKRVKTSTNRGGRKARRRIDDPERVLVNNSAQPPPRFPINCIDEEWLAKLTPAQTRDLKISNIQYDFENGIDADDLL